MNATDTRQVTDHPNHYVDREGRVYVYREGRYVQLKPFPNGRGYLQVSLWDADRFKNVNFLVHRLVAAAYIPNPDALSQVNHKNFDKVDNRVDNLEWCTDVQNTQHAVDSGVFKKRVRHRNSSKLDEAQVRTIRTRQANGETMVALAKEYNVSWSAVKFAVKRRTWKHIP